MTWKYLGKLLQPSYNKEYVLKDVTYVNRYSYRAKGGGESRLADEIIVMKDMP